MFKRIKQRLKVFSAGINLINFFISIVLYADKTDGAAQKFCSCTIIIKKAFAEKAAKAFKAGYSTKKRGWGLGLSLAKRVIKEYHRGDIKIAQTEIGTGTTFRISMKNS